MGKKLYVGNLSFRVTSETLRELFSQAGTVVSASVTEARETGLSRGFGLVEMASDEEAAAAVRQLNGKEVNGRSLTVNESRERGDRGGGRGGYGGGGGDRGGRGGREPR